MQTTTIRLETPQALVMELGKREVTSSWFMRTVDGVTGVEAFIAPDTMVRLELVETQKEPASG